MNVRRRATIAVACGMCVLAPFVPAFLRGDSVKTKPATATSTVEPLTWTVSVEHDGITSDCGVVALTSADAIRIAPTVC